MISEAHYRITVKIADSMDSAMHGGEVGTIYISLRSDKGVDSEKIPLTQNTK